MESTGGSRPGLCVRCAESTHPWSDPHTGGPIRTPESLGAAPLRRLTTTRSGALLPSPDRGPGKVPESTWLLALRCAKIRPLGARQGGKKGIVPPRRGLLTHEHRSGLSQIRHLSGGRV